MISKRKTIKSNGIKQNILIAFIIILLFDLVFIYLHKYYLKNLSIVEFNFFRIGNILDFLMYFIPSIGLIILLYKKYSISTARSFILTLTIILMNLLLLLYIYNNRYGIKFPTDYVWGYPSGKVFIASVFIGHGILTVFFTVILWQTIFYKRKLFYLFSIIISTVVIFAVIIFALTYSGNYFRKIDFSDNNLSKHDVAVVLGAAVWSKNKPSPIFASRIDKAGSLYKSNVVNKIQVTGGNAPGEFTEARVARNVLIKSGIKNSDIWMEENTSSTADQIQFIKQNLVLKKNLKSIIIVSDQFHLKRALEICKFYNIRAKGVAADIELSWEKSYFYRFRDSIALLLFWLYAI